MIASTTPIVISPTWTMTIGVASEISARYSLRVGRNKFLDRELWLVVRPTTISQDPKAVPDSWRLVRRIEEVERDFSCHEGVHQRPPVVGDAPRRDHVRHVPAAALAAEVVVSHSVPAR